jgi:hypothetical protein
MICPDDVGRTPALGVGVTRAVTLSRTVSAHIWNRSGMRLPLNLFSLTRIDAAGDYPGPIRTNKIDCTRFWTASSRVVFHR